MMKISAIISAIPFILFCHYIEAKQECDSKVMEKTPTSQFVVDKVNGTVLDQATKLEWKSCVEGMAYINGGCLGTAILINWNDAMARYDGKNMGWRVPNDTELESTIERKCRAPAMNLEIFPINSQGEPYKSRSIYWTSEQSPSHSMGAITYSTEVGKKDVWAKNSGLRVRLVRDGKWNGAASTQDANSATAIPTYLWNQLTSVQKAQISIKYKINLLADNMLAQIIDAQTLDKSIAASNAGSNLGATVGQAAYIDNAFKGDSINYSAMGQVGAAIVGAVVGSALDANAVPIFKTRYTVKTKANEIQYIDDVTNSPLRHSLGLCVFTSPFGLDKDNLCNMNQNELFVYLANLNDNSKRSNVEGKDSTTILCKVGANAPTMILKSTCSTLGGVTN